MKERLREALAASLTELTGLLPDKIAPLIETPKNSKFGDLAYPCFEAAKLAGESPKLCAERIASQLRLPDGFSSAVAVGPFLNVSFDRAAYSKSIVNCALSGEWAGTPTTDRPVLLEYSSPNIAKSFHVGHLRATLIGNSLDRLYRYLGYNVISINHLGDWGTQFGFVWAGCKLWGKPQNPSVSELVELYRRATSLKERQEKKTVSAEEVSLPDVNNIARAYFVDLERGESYAVEFWQWCLDISMAYFRKTYQRLGVHFDHYTGESFYSPMLDSVKSELEASGLLVASQGALGVDLGEQLGFARVFTADGRSLYLTRDIAAATYRAETFKFAKAIYVVGAPQTLHFQQLKGVLKALGKEFSDNMVHVAFGHVMGMKTRGESGAIELHEFLDEALQRSLTAYNDQVTKRPEGLDENVVAKGVALAAIIFSNLNRQRLKDVHFSWDQALAFQGDTGPYLLYACARINGIKQRALAAKLSVPTSLDDGTLTSDDASYSLVTILADFPHALARSVEENDPCYLALYALELAKTFSKAYSELKVLGEASDIATARLALFEATRLVLSKTLELLGISPLERM